MNFLKISIFILLSVQISNINCMQLSTKEQAKIVLAKELIQDKHTLESKITRLGRSDLKLKFTDGELTIPRMTAKLFATFLNSLIKEEQTNGNEINLKISLKEFKPLENTLNKLNVI